MVIFHSSGEWGLQYQDVFHLIPGGSPLLGLQVVTSYYILTWWRERERERVSTLVSSSFDKATNPVKKALLSWPHLNLVNSPRPQLLMPSLWGLKLQYVEGMQSITTILLIYSNNFKWGVLRNLSRNHETWVKRVEEMGVFYRQVQRGLWREGEVAFRFRSDTWVTIMALGLGRKLEEAFSKVEDTGLGN